MVAAGRLGLGETEAGLLLRLDQGNRNPFEVLEQRDGQGVLVQAGVPLVLAFAFAVAFFLHLRARRHLAPHWRAWLAHRLTADWLGAGGAARVPAAPMPMAASPPRTRSSSPAPSPMPRWC
ncbi:hypothetical protein ACFQS7_09285 [Dankookia sp. GCM10030260]